MRLSEGNESLLWSFQNVSILLKHIVDRTTLCDKMKQLAIFDLDGTLLNTIKDLGEAANYALDRNGFHTHSIASYPFFVGNGVKRLIERVLPEDARKKVHNKHQTS